MKLCKEFTERCTHENDPMVIFVSDDKVKMKKITPNWQMCIPCHWRLIANNRNNVLMHGFAFVDKKRPVHETKLNKSNYIYSQ